MIFPRGGGIYTQGFKIQEVPCPAAAAPARLPGPLYAGSERFVPVLLQILPGHPGGHGAQQLILDCTRQGGGLLEGG